MPIRLKGDYTLSEVLVMTRSNTLLIMNLVASLVRLATSLVSLFATLAWSAVILFVAGFSWAGKSITSGTKQLINAGVKRRADQVP